MTQKWLFGCLGVSDIGTFKGKENESSIKYGSSFLETKNSFIILRISIDYLSYNN